MDLSLSDGLLMRIYKSVTDEIRICGNEHCVDIPLIWTFAFPGAECWCPVCGYTSGCLGAGKIVPVTPILEARLVEYEDLTREYLDARKTLVCSELMYEGKRTKPQDLPKHEIERLTTIIREWDEKGQ